MRNCYILKSLPAVFFILTSVLFSYNCFAQVTRQWVKFYDNPPNTQNIPGGIVADDWGNVYVTGYSTLTNNGGDSTGDYVTVKYNAAGNEEWVVHFDGSGHSDGPSAITIDKAGFIYVTGESERSDLNSDFATVKYNSDGVQQWVAYFNGPDNGYDQPFDIKVEDNGNVYVVGYTHGGNGFPDIALVKYNSSGVQQWEQFYNGPGNNLDVPVSMALNPVNSDVYITGLTSNERSQHDYLTLRYNSAGVLQWARFYNGNNVANTLDEAKKIAVDAQGNAYVGGNSISSENIYGSVTIKYNAAGELLWAQRFTGPANVYGQQNNLAIDKSGNVYITGYVGYYLNGGAKGASATVKYNTDGIQQWMQLNTTPLWNQAQALALDEEGNVYITGRNDGADIWSNQHFITIKYNNKGEKEWVEEYDPTPDWDEAGGIVVNRLGDVFVAGRATKDHVNYAPIYDYVTIKYAQVQPLVVTAVPDTTIYYGYGPNCVQLKAQATGGSTPYGYNWSNGGTNMSVPVCPALTTTYLVTVKDANGLRASAQVTVKVIDITCDSKGKKITVCHKGSTLCIASNAVAEHLQHGDVLGSCIQSNAATRQSNKQVEDFAPALKVTPNPLHSTATVGYTIPGDAYVEIKLLNVNGTEMKSIVRERKVAGSYTVTIDAGSLAPGLYLCRMMVSSSGSGATQVVKLIVK